MEIKRDIYLDRLIRREKNGLIKVVTGGSRNFLLEENSLNLDSVLPAKSSNNRTRWECEKLIPEIKSVRDDQKAI